MALLNEINVKGVPHPIVTDDGYYQEMTVGDAEQLVATTFTEDDAPYNFRTAGGAIDIGDRKQVEGLVGGTVAWNQQAYEGDFSTVTAWTSNVDYRNVVVDNGRGKIAPTEDTQWVQFCTNGNYYDKTKFAKNHKYLFAYELEANIPLTQVWIEIDQNWTRLDQKSKNLPSSTMKTSQYGVLNATAEVSEYTYPRIVIVANGTFVGGSSYCYCDNVQLFDLTQMFGSTVADYIYTLEQNTAGAGVAWFKKLFPKPYYAYNAGQLMSVKALRHITRGFNAWDEEWELGSIDTYGQKSSAGDIIRSKNFNACVGGATYYSSIGVNTVVYVYDADFNHIPVSGPGTYMNGFNTSLAFTVPQNARYFKFRTATTYGTTYKDDICINLHWDGERDGEYEEYVEHVYELDPDLELRGIPKLTAGNDLYYDGDVYEPDGTVTRRYGIVDLGSLTWTYRESGTTVAPYFYASCVNWGIKYTGKPFDVKYNLLCSKYLTTRRTSEEFLDKCICGDGDNTKVLEIQIKDSAYTDATAFKTAMNGVYLVYELETPTEESADPFTSPQVINDFGTEEFVDAGVAAETRDVSIPVGHNSLYQPNLRAKLEMAPESPEDNGYYVVYHHDGINEYVPLIIPQELPNLPSEDGTYTLKCTVASGSATLSFESEV